MPKGRKDEDESKGAKARAQKAAAAAEKEARNQAQKEKEEAEKWSEGANNRKLQKQQEAERAAAEKAAKKAAIDAQLAKEEEELKHQKKLRGQEKVAVRKAQAVEHHATAIQRFHEPALQARNIEDALAVLSIATGDEANTDAATIAAFRTNSNVTDGSNGTSSSVVADLAAAEDKNPEKRMKAAFLRYKEREVPILRKENPGLRLSQIEEIVFKNWQKSPENPLVAAERAKMNSSASWKSEDVSSSSSGGNV